METGNIIEEIHVVIKGCTNTPIDNLVSKSGWGEINFKNLQPTLKMFFNISEDLRNLPINLLSIDVLHRIHEIVKELQQAIDAIKEFDIKTGTPSERQTKISEHFTRNVDRLIAEACPFLVYLAHSEGDAKKYINKLADAKSSTEQILADTEQYVEAKKNKIDDIVIAAQEASASVGVAHFTKNFEEEATELKQKAKPWLRWAGVFGGLTLLAAGTFLVLSFWVLSLNEGNGYEAIHWITTKLIILGTLFSATLWCAKIYKALMHQATVNQHRANSILTFQTFAHAASDVAVKDAVLMETTKTIFEHTPTGYLEKEGSNPKHDQVRVVEMARQTPDTFIPSED